MLNKFLKPNYISSGLKTSMATRQSYHWISLKKRPIKDFSYDGRKLAEIDDNSLQERVTNCKKVTLIAGGTGNTAQDMMKLQNVNPDNCYWSSKHEMPIAFEQDGVYAFTYGVGTNPQKSILANKVDHALGLSREEFDMRTEKLVNFLKIFKLEQSLIHVITHSRGYLDGLAVIKELHDINLKLHDPRLGVLDNFRKYYAGESAGIDFNALMAAIKERDIVEVYNTNNWYDPMYLMYRPELGEANLKVVETKYGHGGGKKSLMFVDKDKIDHPILSSRGNIYKEDEYTTIFDPELTSLDDPLQTFSVPDGKESSVIPKEKGIDDSI